MTRRELLSLVLIWEMRAHDGFTSAAKSIEDRAAFNLLVDLASREAGHAETIRQIIHEEEEEENFETLKIVLSDEVPPEPDLRIPPDATTEEILMLAIKMEEDAATFFHIIAPWFPPGKVRDTLEFLEHEEIEHKIDLQSLLMKIKR